MKSTSFRATISWIFMSGVVMLTGCAAQEAFKHGQHSMQSRDYDVAYLYFKEATSRSPDKIEYRVALEEARGKAEEHHFSQARDYFMKRLLLDAEREIRRSLEYAPMNSDFKAFLAQIVEAMSKAQENRALALSLAQKGERDSAITAIQEAMSIDRSLADGESILASIRNEAAGHYATLARRDLEDGNLSAAENAATKSLDYVASYKPSLNVIEEVRNRREAEAMVSAAKDAFAAKKYEEALSKLSRAQSLHTSRRDIPGLQQQIREAYCREYIQEGTELLAQRDFIRAIEGFRKSQQMLPSFGEVEDLIKEACSGLSAQYRELADSEVRSQRWGNVLIYTLLANAHDVDHTAKERIDEVVVEIEKRLNYRIAFVGFKSTLETQDLAGMLASGLVQDILAAKPKNVSLVERADLDRLAEQDLSATVLFDSDYSVAAGRFGGVNAIIAGELSLFSISHDKTSSNGSSNYQSGTRMVENPDYGVAEVSRNRAARNVAERERDLAASEKEYREVSRRPPTPDRDKSLSALRRAIQEKSQRLESARKALAAEEKKLASIPRMIEEPVSLSYSYPIYQYTKTARMKGSATMVDTETSEVLWSEPIDGQVKVSDRLVDADPFHNVDGDPLKLPDDQEMRDRCIMNAREKMQPTIRRVLQELGEKYRTLATKNESLGHNDEAIDQYVNYLFSGAGTFNSRENVLRKIDLLVKSDPFVSVSGELRKVISPR